jgi:hypothetical protein
MDSAGEVLQDLLPPFFLAETFSKRLQFHGRLMTRDHQLFSGSAIPIEHILLAVPCALEDLMCTKARAGVPRS